MTEQSSERHSGGITDANRRSLRVRIAMKSDVGRVRSENQDFAIVAEDAETNKGHLMIVADGMGGHKGGATASSQTCHMYWWIGIAPSRKAL